MARRFPAKAAGEGFQRGFVVVAGRLHHRRLGQVEKVRHIHIRIAVGTAHEPRP